MSYQIARLKPAPQRLRRMATGVGLIVWAIAFGACRPATPSPTPSTPVPTMIPVTPVTQASAQDGMTLLYVPAGDFKMGAAGSDLRAFDSRVFGDEKPQHVVYLDAFWIDQTEVTNAMFKKFIAATSYQTDADQQGSGEVFNVKRNSWYETPGANWQHLRGPDSNLNGWERHPVVQVSWNDAQAYCQWAGRALPTEAQWEKAARGTDERLYPWGNAAPDSSRLNSNREVDDTTEVSQYPRGASPYGALDMAGNVEEWVADEYSATYYAHSPNRNPAGPGDVRDCVVRGGTWIAADFYVRASYRSYLLPDARSVTGGFRCARSSP